MLPKWVGSKSVKYGRETRFNVIAKIPSVEVSFFLFYGFCDENELRGTQMWRDESLQDFEILIPSISKLLFCENEKYEQVFHPQMWTNSPRFNILRIFWNVFKCLI